MRPSTTSPALAGSGDLIDAALAVNDAATLPDAFSALAEAASRLVGAERTGVVVWDECLTEGTIVAAAGAAVADVGRVIEARPTVRHALETGEPHAGRIDLDGLPRKLAERLEGVETAVTVPVRVQSYRASLHAAWTTTPDEEELAQAVATLQTLVRLTSLSERSLRERDRHRLVTVLAGVADGVIVSADGEVTANAAARSILGVPPGAEIRSELFNPRTLDGEPFALEPNMLPSEYALDGGTTAGRFRIRVTALDGRDVVLDGTLSPTDGGAAIVFRDVTDEHARAVLNERYLYALFNSLPIALTVGSARDRSVVSANQAFLDLVGYDRDEIVGATPPFPWWEPEEDKTAGFEPGTTITRFYRCKDGRRLPVEVASHGIPGDDGETELLLGVIRDLSEQQRLGQQLIQSGKLAAIGELAAGVAHEINNPLFAILGLTEFLLKESESGSRARERLELIQETGLEIKEIVRALLDFARESSDERHIVALEDVVRSTVDLVRRTNAHKGVEIVDSYEAQDMFVDVSPNQVKQLFLNLIANARQAMPGGGIVRIAVERSGANAVVTVADDGPGIEPTVLARIFEPFYTTKRLTGGTGLGLSVSLGIAESHGGSIIGSSQRGHGATFTVRLPLAAPPESE